MIDAHEERVKSILAKIINLRERFAGKDDEIIDLTFEAKSLLADINGSHAVTRRRRASASEGEIR